MDRLTEAAWRNLDPWECCGQDHFCARGCHDEGGCTKGCIVPKLYARCGAYEDTRFTPEEIRALKDCVDGKVMAMVTEIDGVPIDRLRELAEADKDGRIWILPSGFTVAMVNHIMGICERVRAGRLAKGEEDSPVVTWQLYNALVEQSRAEAETYAEARP